MNDTLLIMKQGETDFAYALRLLKKINRLHYGDTPIANLFFYKGYNIWHFYQQRLFEEIKQFSIYKQHKPHKRSFFVAGKEIIAQLFITLMSLLGFACILVLSKKVLVYTVDRTLTGLRCDPRIDSLYTFLVQYNIPYIELVHTVPRRVMYMNAYIRKKFVVYLEAISPISFWYWKEKKVLSALNNSIDYTNFSNDEKVFVQYILKKYIREVNTSIFRIKFLSLIFATTKIQSVFAIDDTRYYNEIILAARLNNINSYAIQHGHFTKYHVGWLNDPLFKGNIITPTKILVWSEYWKKELIRLESVFPEDTICVAGSKSITNKPIKFADRIDQNFGVLIPYETSCPKMEVREYIHKILDCGIPVFFKLRQGYTQEVQLSEYGLSDDMHELFSASYNLEEILPKISIVAGVYSTFLYDMIAYEKRIVILDTSSDYGEGMLTNRLADKLSLSDDICSSLKVINATPIEELRARKEKLFGAAPPLLSNTLLNIGKEEGLL